MTRNQWAIAIVLYLSGIVAFVTDQDYGEVSVGELATVWGDLAPWLITHPWYLVLFVPIGALIVRSKVRMVRKTVVWLQSVRTVE